MNSLNYYLSNQKHKKFCWQAWRSCILLEHKHWHGLDHWHMPLMLRKVHNQWRLLCWSLSLPQCLLLTKRISNDYYLFILVVFFCPGELNIKMRITIFLPASTNVSHVASISILSCGSITSASLGGTPKKPASNFVRSLMVPL